MTMPKTKDAFAFRDFDDERILQRNFFRSRIDAGSGLSDAEVLSMFDRPAESSVYVNGVAGIDVEQSETKCKNLKSIIDGLRDYSSRIKKHVDKLKAAASVLADRIASTAEPNEKWRKQFLCAKCLIQEYERIFRIVNLLRDKAKKKYSALDDVIQREYRKRFATRLRLARLGKKLSQFAVADAIGLTVASYQHYEKGRREPSLTNLIRLANILNVSPNWLLGYAAM